MDNQGNNIASVTISRLVRTCDNGFTAVKGIDLSIRDRELMVLAGPSKALLVLVSSGDMI